jgi:transcriptional regulator with XRE-family HTH domain
MILLNRQGRAVDEQLISRNIKKYRLTKGFSLDQLAKLCGLTKGYVSKIENSQKAPPFSTLIKIATALDVDVGLLIAEDDELPEDTRICVVRKGEGKTVMTRGTLYGYHYEALEQKKIGKNMEPYIILPVTENETVFSHEGEEFQYVLEGIHEFTYGDQKYTLHMGDSIYFDASVSHSGRSIGKKRAKILAIIYSYKR